MKKSYENLEMNFILCKEDMIRTSVWKDDVEVDGGIYDDGWTEE